MKFTLFALLAACCLLSVHAGTAMLEPPQPGMEFLPSDFAEAGEPVDAESFWIFSSMWWAIKAALRTVKGLNCMISWVLGIKENALQFNANVINCGVAVTKDVTNLVNANLKIIATCNNIINLKSTVCATDGEPEEQKITNSCSAKALGQIYTLVKQVKSAVGLAKKLPQTGSNAVACLNSSVNNLTSYYTQFPQNIKSCSKLTSN